MSSSDRVLRSQSATDATVAAAAAEAKGASETDAASEPDVTDVAAAGGVVDGAAPKAAAPKVAAGGRYSGSVVYLLPSNPCLPRGQH